MTTKKSDSDAVAAANQQGEKAGTNRAEQRKQRLAAQLRENLKKRKELARSRKTSGDGSN